MARKKIQKLTLIFEHNRVIENYLTMTNLYRFRDGIYNEHSMIPPLQNLCYNSSTCVGIFGFQSDAWKYVYAFFPRYFEFYRKLHNYFE